MRSFISVLALAGVGWLAWIAWQPPLLSAPSSFTPTPSALVKPYPAPALALPERPGEAAMLWRVVSRRMIVPKSAMAMKIALSERDLHVIPIQRQEQVELHAFDDVRTFARREDAVRARELWKKAGFEAELIKVDAQFGIALGRLYMAAYAQELQQRLQKSKRQFAYHRRQLNIPTWRFTFPAAPYAQAKALWLKVQETGVADPVLMRESRFKAAFGELTLADEAVLTPPIPKK